jgi:hypothetical protein
VRRRDQFSTQGTCSLSLFLAAVKAITAAQLSMASDGIYSVTLDEAIEAMRLTAADMSVKYKETSLSVRGFYDLCSSVLNIIVRFTGSSRELLTKFMHLARLMTTNADYCEDPFDRPHLVRVTFIFVVLIGVF